MNIPRLADEDLERLGAVFPDLDFSDSERRAVLLAHNSVDVHAAPGSGKTSILAAKLFLLSSSWAFPRRGICVISHTNVARDEICRRLAGTAEGSRLLGYPHFIGTIHAFINRFLAFPNLQSNGIRLEIIDDDVFGRRAWSAAQRSPANTWLRRQANGESLVAGLTFVGPNFELISRNGSLPGAGQTFDALEGIKNRLSAAGCFRYEDMFAFAENLLDQYPWVRDRISYRFPLLMIDEMQDTSVEQERLVKAIFNDQVVRQRFGDINQRILGEAARDGDLTFPENPILPIRTSRRFGRQIAKAVAAVQVTGDAVVGEGADSPAPILLLYRPEAVNRVVEAFGHLVLNQFSDDTLRDKRVVAICARRGGQANQPPGRHIVDYWPSFEDVSGLRAARAESAWFLLRDDIGGKKSGQLRDRVDRVRRVVWLALKQSGAEIAQGLRDPTKLVRAVQQADMDARPLVNAYRTLALSSGLQDVLDETVAPTIFQAVQDYLPVGFTQADFAALSVFGVPEEGDAIALSIKSMGNTCEIIHDGRELRISIDTVGMTKGETHFATLVLESYGKSRRFDIAEAQSLLSGRHVMGAAVRDTIKSQFRYLYVAMSRPSALLCLAMNIDRADPADLAGLHDEGWKLMSVV